MEQPFVQRDLEDMFEAADESEVRVAVARQQPGYRPTPWPIVNRVLDSVDALTGGRALWVQRFFTFAFFGGVCALVNLLVFFIVYHRVALPVSDMVHNGIANVLAGEISLVANFVLNDYFTFRHHPGRRGSWLARCARFHVTSLGGTFLTFLIQFALAYGVHIPSFFAQAVALIIVMFYNFSFHHLFTYRHVKTVISAQLSVTGEPVLLSTVITDVPAGEEEIPGLAPVDVVTRA